MSVRPVYRTSVQAVLLAARDLEEALDAGETDEAISLTGNLLSAALARESGGAVAGFRSDDASSAPGTAGLSTVEEELSLTLTELEIGEVLLTSAAATQPRPSAGGSATSAPLGEAIDQLAEAGNQLVHAGAAPVSSLFGDRTGNRDDFFTLLPKTVDGIVQRTADLGVVTFGGLLKIPVAQLQPVVASAISAAEITLGAGKDLGALVKAGMRAVRRAVRALTELVPENLREQVRAWAKDLWEQRGASLLDALVRRVLSVAELQAAITQAVASIERRDDLDPALQNSAARLLELDERHSRITKLIERIVGALSRLIGPVVTAFPPAAPWVYSSGGGGMVTALGASVWIGRDYLDAGVPFERVPGVRTLLSDATAARSLG
jgi:hypothetical protein